MAIVSNEIIDEIVEWIGLKYTKSQIKNKLRKAYMQLTTRTMEDLITLARQKIRQMYKIDPMEFKGSSIEFYCSVIRNENADLRLKILCQERLDKLLGIEHVASEDPNSYADKVIQAMAEADGSVTGDMPDEKTIEENYKDVFCDLDTNDLPDYLKPLAENLAKDDTKQ